jgi:hypothetical protein
MSDGKRPLAGPKMMWEDKMKKLINSSETEFPLNNAQIFSFYLTGNMLSRWYKD